MTDWLNRNVVVKHLVLLGCGVVGLMFLVHVVLGVFTRHNRHEVVPDFLGMTMDEARAAGRGGRLRLEVNDSIYDGDYGPGVVLVQRPAAGSEVKSGRRILVTVNASAPLMVRVPYVTGVSLRQATSDLQTAGFHVKEIVYRPDIATDYVLETRYEGRKVTREGRLEAPAGSGITLIVGRNDGE